MRNSVNGNSLQMEQREKRTHIQTHTHTIELPLAVEEGQRKRKLCWHFSGEGKTVARLGQ